MSRKNEQLQSRRAEFISLALNNKDEFATELKKRASAIMKAKDCTEVVEQLSSLLFLSESTIWRDLKRE